LPSFLIFLFLIFIIFLFVSVSCGCNNKKKFHHLLKHKRFQTVFFSVCCVCAPRPLFTCVWYHLVCMCVCVWPECGRDVCVSFSEGWFAHNLYFWRDLLVYETWEKAKTI
jgi:hypothetical protein